MTTNISAYTVVGTIEIANNSPLQTKADVILMLGILQTLNINRSLCYWLVRLPSKITPPCSSLKRKWLHKTTSISVYIYTYVVQVFFVIGHHLILDATATTL